MSFEERTAKGTAFHRKGTKYTKDGSGGSRQQTETMAGDLRSSMSLSLPQQAVLRALCAFVVRSRRRSPFLRHSAIGIRQSAFGLTLVEILIALFIFLIGIMGVLAVFPVAMNSAGRTIGDVRANLHAQSAIAQMTCDAKVRYQWGTVSSAPPSPYTTLACTPAADSPTGALPVGYFVTVTASDGSRQCRQIVPTGITPAWTPPYPVAGNAYVVTRLGLTDPPLAAASGQFGLNREFYVRRIISSNSVEIGLLDTPCGQASGGTTSTVVDNSKTWVADCYKGYVVQLTGGTGAGQERIVTGNNTSGTLNVSPAFTTAPDATTLYALKGINEMSHYASTVTADVAAPYVTLTDSSGNSKWKANQFAGHLVRITGGKCQWQVRQILSNTKTVLTVSAPFTWNYSDGGDGIKIGDAYEIGWPDGTLNPPTPSSPISDSNKAAGFVVFTSGKAAGRVCPITDSGIITPATGSTTDTGYQITCDGADFINYGVTAAERRLTTGYSYKPSDATTLTIIGNSSPAGIVSLRPNATDYPYYPNASSLGLPPAGDPAYLNTFGVTATDPLLAQTFAETYGLVDSEYSLAAVMSDSGVSVEGPVRVDVFVFRNYDNAKSLCENQRPVGFMSGYIRRP